MNLQARIQVFTNLGQYLKTDIYQEAVEELNLAKVLNPWFTKENIDKALSAWHEQLKVDMLTAWLNPYKLQEVSCPKKVLIIMAGNIPLVGFHDFLTVLISGHKVVVKMSSTDNVLLKVLIEKLISIAPEFKESIAFIDDVKNRKFDAVIATGSDN
jgi:predicted phage-related endonuclease